MNQYYVYILASTRNGTLYVGVTSDLLSRVYQHKNNLVEGFTKKYKVHRLVYFEETSNIYSAIQREKQLKNWKRDWKIQLIESVNATWSDLYSTIISGSRVPACRTGRKPGMTEPEVQYAGA